LVVAFVLFVLAFAGIAALLCGSPSAVC